MNTQPLAVNLDELIVDSIQDIKGKAITRIDLRNVDDAPTDTFIICQADSHVQVRAIAENIRRRVQKEMGERPGSAEGFEHGKWICLDYFDTIVHVFYHETRDFYDLESLWGDAPTYSYDDDDGTIKRS